MKWLMNGSSLLIWLIKEIKCQFNFIRKLKRSNQRTKESLSARYTNLKRFKRLLRLRLIEYFKMSIRYFLWWLLSNILQKCESRATLVKREVSSLIRKTIMFQITMSKGQESSNGRMESDIWLRIWLRSMKSSTRFNVQ